MSFIATRGFLGTIKDVVLRGFGIGEVIVPRVFSMSIDDMDIRPTMAGTLEARPSLTAKVEAGHALSVASSALRPV